MLGCTLVEAEEELLSTVEDEELLSFLLVSVDKMGTAVGTTIGEHEGMSSTFSTSCWSGGLSESETCCKEIMSEIITARKALFLVCTCMYYNIIIVWELSLFEQLVAMCRACGCNVHHSMTHIVLH